MTKANEGKSPWTSMRNTTPPKRTTIGSEAPKDAGIVDGREKLMNLSAIS